MTTNFITSRWPILRTNPAGTETAGGMAILTAILSVVVLGPMLGFVMTFAPKVFGPTAAWAEAVQTVGILVMLSFVLSWIALIPAVPVAILCANYGYAGWITAVLGGIVAGTVTILVMDSGLDPVGWATFTATAVFLALTCWITVRLFHPAFIGIPPTSLTKQGS